MKLYLLLLFLLFSTITTNAQTATLASVEIIEVGLDKTPPVEKKKQFKKKKRRKKQFKKPNKTQKNNKDRIKFGLLFNLIGTSSIFTLSSIATVIFLLLGSLFYIFTIIFAGASLVFALIFLTIFLIYVTTKKRNQEKKIILKRPEEIIRAEVAYLNEEKVNLYLTYNENLTTAKIRKDILLRTREEKNAREWAAAKLEIKELDAKIKRAKAQIKELQRQNKTMKVRQERS